MKKRLSTICFATILLVSFLMVQTSNAAVASLYVSPSKSTGWPLDTVGGHGYNTFQTEIKVSDVVDLYGWQFWFHWNPAVVNLTGYFEGSFLKGPFSYQTIPKVNARNITVTNPTNAYDEDMATYSNLTYGQQVSAVYDLYPDDFKMNVTVTTPLYAFDRANDTRASMAYAQATFEDFGGNFTLYNFEVGSGTIQQVDLKMRFNITAATNDQYRIVYYVLPSTAKQVLIDWTSAAQPLNTVTWANRVEPNDGTWSWTDIHNINFMIETNRVGTYDNKRIDVWEAWATVSATSDVGSFRMASFGIPLTNYPIDRVDLKLRYSAEAASDDQYRIQYYVTHIPPSARPILLDWTSAAKALDTVTWSGVTEPIDGTWSWLDVSNLNFEIATRIAGASDNKQIRVYEAWVVVKYHRGTNPQVTLDYTNGYIFYGSTVLAPSNGADGSGTIAVLRFKVKTSGTSVLQFISPGPTPYTKLVDSDGDLITHTPVDGSFTAPPWVEDINGDGYVDIQDIALVGIGWGKTSADLNWAKYKDADVNKDNQIDAGDLGAVAVKWSYGTYL